MASLLQTVLVVDEQAGVCGRLAETLRFDGYECDCFADSIEAVAS